MRHTMLLTAKECHTLVRALEDTAQRLETQAARDDATAVERDVLAREAAKHRELAQAFDCRSQINEDAVVEVVL